MRPVGPSHLSTAAARPAQREGGRPRRPGKPQILVVEDDPGIAAMYAAYLSDCDITVRSKPDLAVGYGLRSPVDLAVVDIALGDEPLGGLRVIEALSAPGVARFPIMGVSGSQQTDLPVLVLNAGAVDFLTKPFLPEEFRARISRHLRTANAQAAAYAHHATAQQASDGFEFAGAAIRPDGTVLFPDSPTPVPLARKLRGLLRIFHEHRGRVVPKTAISLALWGPDAAPDNPSVAVYVSQLVRVYRAHGLNLRAWVHGQYGVGWRISAEAEGSGKD